MAIGIAKIEAAPAVPGVELTVFEVPGIAAVGDARGAHALEDRIELRVIHVESVMMTLEAVLIGKVEGERRTDAHRGEMSPRPVIGEPEDIGEKPRRRILVMRRDDRVVEGDGHGLVPLGKDMGRSPVADYRLDAGVRQAHSVYRM